MVRKDYRNLLNFRNVDSIRIKNLEYFLIIILIETIAFSNV